MARPIALVTEVRALSRPSLVLRTLPPRPVREARRFCTAPISTCKCSCAPKSQSFSAVASRKRKSSRILYCSARAGPSTTSKPANGRSGTFLWARSRNRAASMSWPLRYTRWAMHLTPRPSSTRASFPLNANSQNPSIWRRVLRGGNNGASATADLVPLATSASKGSIANSLPGPPAARASAKETNTDP